MALRFRKSIKLAPGIRWNLSGTGSSWTIGPRGASVGIGKRGVYLNSGIPGTGISSRSRLSGPSQSNASRASTPATSVLMTCAILDDGTLSFTDRTGTPVPEHVVEAAKKQNREAILELIQRKCDEINEQTEALGKLHHDTPNPRTPPKYIAPAFSEPRPSAPAQWRLGLLDRVIPGRRGKIDEANRAADAHHRDTVATWETEKAKFDRRVAERKVFLESLIYKDITAMERFLEETLEEIVWPRETIVTFDVRGGGSSVALDVDLPEVEDMPNKLAAVPSRGLKLSVKELSATKVQKLYAEHIHGIVFRLVGEVFAALPTIQEVIAAGYSQRRDPATAQERDDYLLSVRASRPEWSKMDFAHLPSLDVTEALKRFDLQREMSKSGIFKPIVPHG
jgi:Protein of unknown function (DUF4236)